MNRRAVVRCAVGLLATGEAARAQAPAVAAATMFLPGLVSTGREFTVTFSADGRELYFTRSNAEPRSLRIMRSLFVSGAWATPEPVTLRPGQWNDLDPALSPDGQRLYFVSMRPRPGGAPTPPNDMDLWFSRRTADGWDEPQWIGTASSDGKEGSPTVDRAGNLCFFSDRGRKANENAIYCANAIPGGWSTPVRIDGGINEGPSNTSPSLSPDGKTMLFYSTRDGGYGKGDLYYSEQMAGTWGQPQTLGPAVNTSAFESNPSVSPDGTVLYFGRQGRIYSIPLARLGILALTPARFTR